MQGDPISKFTYWKLKKLDEKQRSKQLKPWDEVREIVVVTDLDVVGIPELDKVRGMFEGKRVTIVGVTKDKALQVDFPVFYKKRFLFFQWLKPAENAAESLPNADLAFVFADGELWALAMALLQVDAQFRVCSSDALTEFCDLTVIARGGNIADFISQALKYLHVLHGKNN